MEVVANVGDWVDLGGWAEVVHFLIDGAKFWICGADDEMEGDFGAGEFGPE